MHTLRCIFAEWDVVRARLVHTRLGVWLLLLAAALVWSAQDEVFLTAAAFRTGLLAGVCCVAFAAGAANDRAAFATTLGHPTSPLALAAGRWLAACIAAALPVAGVTLTLGILRGNGPDAVLWAALVGVIAAAAVAGCALPLVLVGGNTLAGLLLLYLVGAGLLSTTASRLPHPVLHALGWSVGGILASALVLSRRR